MQRLGTVPEPASEALATDSLAAAPAPRARTLEWAVRTYLCSTNRTNIPVFTSALCLLGTHSRSLI